MFAMRCCCLAFLAVILPCLACLPPNSRCLKGVDTARLHTEGTFDEEITDPPDLTCDFSKPCCWKSNDPSGLVGDVIIKKGNLGKYPECGSTVVPAESNFYTIYNKNAHAGVVAEVSSCTIKCSMPGLVGLWVYKSARPQVDVCWRSTKDVSRRLNDCQRSTAANGVRQYFQFHSMVDSQIVITATNFADQAQFVTINDIIVNLPKCDTTTTTTTTTTAPTGGNACKKLTCSFRRTLCNWRTGGSRTFQPRRPREQVGNPDTGVNVIANQQMNKPHVSQKLSPHTKAYLVVDGLDLPNDFVLKFRVYEATEMEVVKVCLENMNNCKDVTDRDVTVSDRRWNKAKAILPAGTKRVYIVGDNYGPYYGAVGIAKIRVKDRVTRKKCR